MDSLGPPTPNERRKVPPGMMSGIPGQRPLGGYAPTPPQQGSPADTRNYLGPRLPDYNPSMPPQQPGLGGAPNPSMPPQQPGLGGAPSERPPGALLQRGRRTLPMGYEPKKRIWTKENIGHVGGQSPVTQGLLDFLNTGIRPEPTPRPPGMIDQSRGYSPTRRRYTRY